MGVADDFSAAFRAVTKDLYREKKRRERAGRTRRVYAPSYRVTLRDAVFDVLPEAYAAATGGEAFETSARTLYYQVRPRVQAITSAELGYSYFSQQLLVGYQVEYGALRNLYYEPRGELHEPHTGRVVPIESSYVPPAWTFDKALYVEKQGLWPVLEQAQLAERYDMAILTGNGYATEACRELLARAAEGSEMRIFVLHDADPAGYNIARTLGEETRRMPGHFVEIFDLGLTVDDAIGRGLPTETFTRRRALPGDLESRLSTSELEWFEGVPRGYGSVYDCLRVELNAFTSPALIDYIEQGLAAAGAAEKLVPPDETIEKHAEQHHRAVVSDAVKRVLEQRVDVDELIDTLVNDTTDLIDVDADYVRGELAGNPPESWRAIVENQIAKQLGANEDEDDEPDGPGSLDARVGALLDERGIGDTPTEGGGAMT